MYMVMRLEVLVPWSITFVLLMLNLPASQAQEDMYSGSIKDWKTPFEKDQNYTADHSEIIEFYERLAQESDRVELKVVGQTDVGRNLHLVILSSQNRFLAEQNRDRAVFMINNAIHPGEPCGVDASMMLARDLVSSKEGMDLLDQVTIIIIPAYNLGGVLNRNSHSRANQLGPKIYGFRGNAQNLDLNRDFVKSDSKNARVFHRVFSQWRPQVFVDTHTTNGADYPYTMTLIPTQKNQLGGPMMNLMRNDFLPQLYDQMESSDWPMSPYVFTKTEPKDGIMDFNDSPRFSSGYASLMHCMSFVSEAHMLKPYVDRVHATYTLLDEMANFVLENAEEIVATQRAQIEHYGNDDSMGIKWKLDETQCDSFLFEGYPRKSKKSNWSGGNRTYYDHEDAFEKYIPYCTQFEAVEEVRIPQYYIIPQAYDDLIDKLRDNHIEFDVLEQDSLFELELYRINDFNTVKYPYEGHYVHSEVELESFMGDRMYFKGDVLVPTQQFARRFIVSCLEPVSVDSWFNWNFFDGILMQKEHFSPYVFEDTAEEILKNNEELQKALEEKKESDPEWAKSTRNQMDFIYKNSPHYEPSHRLYPVGRIF